MSRGGTITLPPQESASKPQHRELTSLPNGVQLDTVPAPSDAKSSTSSPSLSDSLRSLRDPTPSPTCFTTAVVKDHRCSASFSPTTVAAPDRIASHTPLIADNNNNNNNKSGTPADVNDWFRPRDSSANFTLDTRSKTPFSIPALQATQSTGSLQRRPRDRLNAILAGERGTSYLISDAPPIQASRDCASAHSGLTATTRVRSPPVLRSVTAPVLPTVSYSSPHSPPLNMAPPAGNATRTAIMDRNSSMDSAISSLSSTSVSQPSTTSTTHSHRGSSETINAVDPDPATLVTRAGSAEKAIQKLLEERRAQSRKQDKAWEIIEKMKAMVVGLNKDLEKVSKEKERYRKRLKEFQTAAASTSPPPVPSNNADMKSLDRHIDRTNHDRTVETKVMVENTNGKSQQILPRSPTATSRGTRLLKGQGALPSEVDETSPLEKTPTNPQKPFPSPQAANSLSQDHETHSPITPKAHQSKPSWSSPGEKSRKPAPAPLDLSQKSPSKLARGDTEEGESALDLDSEVDEDGIPKFERGRRRTRAEDDRQRELVAMVEDHRSKSNKSNKSKSMSKSKSKGMSKLVDEQADPKAGEPPTASSGDSELPAGMIAGVGLPSSPRANLLGALQSPLQDSMGSIASAIAPAKSTGVGKPTEPQTATFPPKSPGLPMSPRPGDRPPNSAVPRMPASGFTTPGPGPASPRSGLPLSPRAPKHPIPLPRSATVAAFPPTAPSESSKNDHSLQPMSMAERLKLGFPNATSNKPAPIQVHAPPTPTVYKGFMTEQYAGLLLPPNALPLIDVRVFSSRLTPSRSSFQSMISGEDDPHFTLAVHARSDNKQLWRVEKSLQVLFKLDQQVRKAINFRGALPDRNLFSGHAPAKVDARRAALHRYFEEVLDTPMDERAALVVCDFFSQHVIDPGDSSSPTPNDTDSGVSVPGSPTKQERPKEGWLSKKGKQFGGWKERYFILKNSELRHFESPTGPALGIIKLQHAQVGRPSPRSQEEDAEFRHAFTISEPKRRDSSSMMRHVLCAESDEERDSWVEALLAHIDHSDPKTSPAQPSMSFRSPSFSLKGSDANKIRKKNPEMVENTAPVTKQFQSLSYDQTVAAQAPTVGTPKRLPSEFPLEEQAVDDTVPSSHPVISGPVAGGPIQNLASWGNKDARKRSVFGLLNRSLDDSAIGGSKFGRGISPRPPQPERHSPMRQVFGVPLLEATATCRPEGVDVCLPAIVYRCIEYLEAKEAVLEEGIFRVPGSNTVINRLKDRFNTEGDVKLLDGAHIDIHAVASLLKAYLRELPESILTKEHHHDFSKVIGKSHKLPLDRGNFLIRTQSLRTIIRRLLSSTCYSTNSLSRTGNSWLAYRAT